MTTADKATMKLTRLYATDETGWLEQMARLIQKGRRRELDYRHLTEFLRDMAKRDRREVANRLTTLLAHLLKWDHQPRKRARSWKLTIFEQQRELRRLLDSLTLKNHAETILTDVYGDAVKEASIETGISEERFPTECPYSVDGLLSGEHLPL